MDHSSPMSAEPGTFSAEKTRTPSMNIQISEEMMSSVNRRRERQVRKKKREDWISQRRALVENDLKKSPPTRLIADSSSRSSPRQPVRKPDVKSSTAPLPQLPTMASPVNQRRACQPKSDHSFAGHPKTFAITNQSILKEPAEAKEVANFPTFSGSFLLEGFSFSLDACDWLAKPLTIGENITTSQCKVNEEKKIDLATTVPTPEKCDQRNPINMGLQHCHADYRQIQNTWEPNAASQLPFNKWEGWDQSKIDETSPKSFVKKKKIVQPQVTNNSYGSPTSHLPPSPSQSSGLEVCPFGIGDMSRYILESETRVFKWIELKMGISGLLDNLDLWLTEEAFCLKEQRELSPKLVTSLAYVYSLASLGGHLKVGDLARTAQIWERSVAYFSMSTRPTKTRLLTLVTRIMFLLINGNQLAAMELTGRIAETLQKRHKLNKRVLDKNLVDACHLVMFMSTEKEWEKMAMMKILNEQLPCITNRMFPNLTFFSLVSDHMLNDVLNQSHISVPKILLVCMMLSDVVDMKSPTLGEISNMYSLLSVMENAYGDDSDGGQILQMLDTVMLSVKCKMNQRVGKYDEAVNEAREAIRLGNILVSNFLDSIWIRIALVNCMKVLPAQNRSDIEPALDVITALKRLGYHWPSVTV